MANVLPNEQLLHKCAEALERLLASPDLHLDCLEQPTRDAIAYAHAVLQTLNARRQAVYCVLCGELQWKYQWRRPPQRYCRWQPPSHPRRIRQRLTPRFGSDTGAATHTELWYFALDFIPKFTPNLAIPLGDIKRIARSCPHRRSNVSR